MTYFHNHCCGYCNHFLVVLGFELRTLSLLTGTWVIPPSPIVIIFICVYTHTYSVLLFLILNWIPFHWCIMIELPYLCWDFWRLSVLFFKHSSGEPSCAHIFVHSNYCLGYSPRRGVDRSNGKQVFWCLCSNLSSGNLYPLKLTNRLRTWFPDPFAKIRVGKWSR
jgi:hypothetical protein